MKVSSVIWPASIMSSACSHTAVVPGSAIAAGTASINVKAASDARMARPFFNRYPRASSPLMMLARVASVPMPVVSLSFCFRRGSVTSLATPFMALTSSPCV